jgi:hypothetical protein
MDVVKQAESPWDHSVQLENTHQLLDLLSQVKYVKPKKRKRRRAGQERIANGVRVYADTLYHISALFRQEP